MISLSRSSIHIECDQKPAHYFLAPSEHFGALESVTGECELQLQIRLFNGAASFDNHAECTGTTRSKTGSRHPSRNPRIHRGRPWHTESMWSCQQSVEPCEPSPSLSFRRPFIDIGAQRLALVLHQSSLWSRGPRPPNHCQKCATGNRVYLLGGAGVDPFRWFSHFPHSIRCSRHGPCKSCIDYLQIQAPTLPLFEASELGQQRHRLQPAPTPSPNIATLCVEASPLRRQFGSRLRVAALPSPDSHSDLPLFGTYRLSVEGQYCGISSASTPSTVGSELLFCRDDYGSFRPLLRQRQQLFITSRASSTIFQAYPNTNGWTTETDLRQVSRTPWLLFKANDARFEWAETSVRSFAQILSLPRRRAWGACQDGLG